ncbi:MAG: UDP-2,3-diacylglucosamine diphosphatase [Gemmatimonadetes bacterium]|nr:UDP-2,3-diacylglucosamine diphosphatase [Gemmatimonadota bacterium]
MTRPEFIASDVHLGAVPRATEHDFLRFLEHVGGHGRSLLLVGDLFDFWFEYGDVIPGKHFRVLAALARLVEAGIPVTLLGGNHDAWGGRFLREEVGVAFHTGMLRTELGGRPALVAHGDGLGRGDFRYRVLKSVLRSRAAIAGFRALHPELGVRLARLVSTTETRGESEEVVRGRARFIEEWARRQLRDDPSLGWVVCGHAHVPAVVEEGAGRFYLNAGDWVQHQSFITVAAGIPELHAWSGTRGGHSRT